MYIKLPYDDPVVNNNKR